VRGHEAGGQLLLELETAEEAELAGSLEQGSRAEVRTKGTIHSGAAAS
jgi:hypothetical protein